ARKLGYRPIVINYNPETVSTDWDVSEDLLFDEISVETVKEAYRKLRPLGVVAFLGGQLSNNIAGRLEEEGVPLIGTPGRSVDVAEDRARIHELLEGEVLQPPWTEASSLRDAIHFADSVGYPVIVRPSYVLSGTSIRVAWSREDLVEAYNSASRSSRGSVVLSKLIDGVEADLDAVGDGTRWVGAVIEHIEPPGVHSGDSTMVLPHYSMPRSSIEAMARAASIINSRLGVKGPFNIQFITTSSGVYLIEVNLRASRSMPFTSKVTGYNLMRAAAQASLLGGISDGVEGLLSPSIWGVKSPQFSWHRIKGAYPGLGPEMRSTGEVASLGRSMWEALLKSWLSVQGNRIPGPGSGVLVYTPTGHGARELGEAARILEDLGYRVYTMEGMEAGHGTPLDPGEAVGMIRSGGISLVATTGYAPARDYRIRRTSVDMGVSIILNHRLALMLSRAMARVSLEGIKPIPLGAGVRVEEAWR
ncbi:MAG: carbamoyl phosphate synthase large subunit, partial [Desulfurococcales archaeon]|nr:carbamoyl phosphate synthase large subunit [Desulfurococcales archaeon]